MKYIVIFFTALLATSCTMHESQNIRSRTSIPKTNFSLQLPTSTHIKVLGEGADTYQDGMRLYISSHSHEEFQQLAKKNHLDLFFSFWIYQKMTWNGSVNDWLEKNCVNPVMPKKTYKKDSITIIEAEQRCFSETIFAVFEDGTAYKIQTSPDTSNPELIWNVLQTIQLSQ